MAPVTIAPVRYSAFEAEARLEPPALLARMAGIADVTSQEHLGHFLEQVDRSAREAHVSLVRVDLTGVEFLNSTSMGAFAAWFSGVAAADPLPYGVTLVFRSGKHRPRRSLEGFVDLFPFVRVEP